MKFHRAWERKEGRKGGKGCKHVIFDVKAWTQEFKYEWSNTAVIAVVVFEDFGTFRLSTGNDKISIDSFFKYGLTVTMISILIKTIKRLRRYPWKLLTLCLFTAALSYKARATYRVSARAIISGKLPWS